jgi:hypothetical protein
MICPVPLLLSVFYTPSLVLLSLAHREDAALALDLDSSDGVPDVSDSTRELEFFFKLDDKRYRGMLQYYGNRALDNDANAYPQRLVLCKGYNMWKVDIENDDRWVNNRR